MALGEAGNADAAFARALAAAPNDSQVWTDFGRFRRSTGDLAGAIEAADRAVAAGPRNAEALILRGELTRGQYGLAAAIPWFDRAIEVDSGNVVALLERAATFADMGRMGDMLADARKVIQLTGGHPRAYYLQAVLAARARNFPLARRLWNRTRGAYDDTPAGMLLIGAIDYETGNEEQAARRLAELVRRQPGNRRARRCSPPPVADERSGRRRRDLRPLADRPTPMHALSLIGRALARTGDATAPRLSGAPPCPTGRARRARSAERGQYAGGAGRPSQPE